MDEIKNAVIAGAVPVVVMLIGWAFSWFRAYLQSKIKNETLRRISAEAFEVVAAVGQAIGDDLKEAGKDGKLSEDEKAMLKTKAMNALMARLKDIPAHVIPDLGERVSEAIEAAVAGKK